MKVIALEILEKRVHQTNRKTAIYTLVINEREITKDLTYGSQSFQMLCSVHCDR